MWRAVEGVELNEEVVEGGVTATCGTGHADVRARNKKQVTTG